MQTVLREHPREHMAGGASPRMNDSDFHLLSCAKISDFLRHCILTSHTTFFSCPLLPRWRQHQLPKTPLNKRSPVRRPLKSSNMFYTRAGKYCSASPPKRIYRSALVLCCLPLSPPLRCPSFQSCTDAYSAITPIMARARKTAKAFGAA
jgi:hypothetical protein